MVENVVLGMCTKDEAGVIGETMRAVRMQTRPPDSVYICDDSDDATPEIVRDELEKSDIPFEIFNQEHYDGHGGARQELYERVRAVDPDILCLLDANNTVDKDWLENLLDFWEDNPKYDALTGPHCSYDVHREAKSPHDPFYYRHATIAFKMDLLDEIGGWDPDFGRGEDWDLALQMYRTGAKVFTSSQWCSRYVRSDPPRLVRKRIAGNPTSVPYLAKHGLWYARFHPGQLLKDGGSFCFYALLASTLVFGMLASEVGLFLGGITAVFVATYIVAFVAYSDSFGADSVKRAVYLLVYTMPAMGRSLREVFRGNYRMND